MSEPHERDGTFVRVTRRQLLGAMLAVGVTAGGIEELLQVRNSAARPGLPAAADYLALIVLDGFRSDYASLAPMPALQRLMARGTSFDRAWVGQVASVTPASHASLSTATFPRRHGVIGFQWRDPGSRKIVIDGWDQETGASAIIKDLRESGAISLPSAVKSANPSATAVSISSEKVYAADAMAGPEADYILQYRPNGHHALEAAGVGGHLPPAGFLDELGPSRALPLDSFSDWDDLSAKLAVASIKRFQPEVLMVNLPGADVYGHLFGGPATPRVMRQVVAGLDRNIAQIEQTYREAGIHSRTLFVVTADHGMAQNLREVSPTEVGEAVERAGAHHLFHTGGTASYVYLRDPQHAAAVAREMARLPNVAGAYYQVRRQGKYSYLPAAGMKLPSALDAAYRYLLSTFAGPTAPDVAAPYHENTIGRSVKFAYGHHGGLNWGVQHVPLVLAGPGVRSGAQSHFPARMVDIGATMQRLMGVPQKVDGTVLADALTSPGRGEPVVQRQLASVLLRYQNALLARYRSDNAEDRREHLRSLPSLPPKP